MSGKTEQRAGLALVLFAIVLRAAVYLDNRAFWGDEVMIALNIRGRDLLGLLAPLDFDQTMPIPLLLMTKPLTMLLGHHEMVYRLPMFLAGCVLPILVWRWFPSVVGRVEALIILAFIAIWQPLIYYSSELKQYEFDALATVMLIAVALRLFREAADPAAWRRMIGAGVVALLVSQPSVFVLAGVACGYLADRRIRTDRTWRNNGVRAMLVWGATFLVVFFGSYRYSMDSAYMRHYWESAFLRPGPGWTERFLDAAWTLSAIHDLPGMRTIYVVPLAVLGALLVWRRLGTPALLLLVIPFAAVVAAAILGLYPIAGRLVLFTVPLLLWSIASAITGFSRRFSGAAAGVVAAVIFGILWAPASLRTVRFAADPPPRETVRQMAHHIARVDPRAPTMLLFGSYQGWAFYTGDWSKPAQLGAQTRQHFQCETDPARPPTCDRLSFVERPGAPPALIAATPRVISDSTDQDWADTQAGRLLALPERRAWILYSIYNEGLVPRRLIERILARLEARGARIEAPVTLGESALFRVALP